MDCSKKIHLLLKKVFTASTKHCFPPSHSSGHQTLTIFYCPLLCACECRANNRQMALTRCDLTTALALYFKKQLALVRVRTYVHIHFVRSHTAAREKVIELERGDDFMASILLLSLHEERERERGRAQQERFVKIIFGDDYCCTEDFVLVGFSNSRTN